MPDVARDIVFDDVASLRLTCESSATRSAGSAELGLRLRFGSASTTRSFGVAELAMRLRFAGASQTRSTGSARLRPDINQLRLSGVSQTRSRGSSGLRLVTVGERMRKARATLLNTELKGRLV